MERRARAALGFDYCGSLLPHGASPVARADFSGAVVTGWQPGASFQGRPLGGSPCAWALTQQPDPQNHPLLIAPGSYDDFEVELTFRLRASQPRDGFFLRARGAQGGAITLHGWSDGSLSLGWQQPDHEWQQPIARSPAPPACHAAGWRHLRWLACGARHRVYLDHQLLLSARHEAVVHSGYLDVRIQALTHPVTLEVCRLELHEAAET